MSIWVNKSICFILISVASITYLFAQELNARVVVNAQQLGSMADQATVRNMETQISEFLNNKKWTNDVFLPQERIACNFSITLRSVANQNAYEATLVVQAGRPIFNAVYQSSLVNYRDEFCSFKYLPSQRLDFDATRSSSGDPLGNNLTYILSYWVHIILGMHYDSFELRKGTPYFKVAQDIVNAAPKTNSIKGWQLFDGQRSRFVLASNLNSPSFDKMHTVFYNYYRRGMDSLYQDASKANANIVSVLNDLRQLFVDNTSSMLIPFFIENRGGELAGIFKNAQPQMKNEALQILTLLDPGNIELYNEIR